MVKIMQLCLCLTIIILFSEGNTEGVNELYERNTLRNRQHLDTSITTTPQLTMFPESPRLDLPTLLTSCRRKAKTSVQGSAARPMSKITTKVGDIIYKPRLYLMHNPNIIAFCDIFKRSLSDTQNEAISEVTNKDLLDTIKSALEPKRDSSSLSSQLFGTQNLAPENVKPDILSLLQSLQTLVSDESKENQKRNRNKRFVDSLSNEPLSTLRTLAVINHFYDPGRWNIVKVRDINGIKSAESSKSNYDSTNLLDEALNVGPDSKRSVDIEEEEVVYNILAEQTIEELEERLRLYYLSTGGTSVPRDEILYYSKRDLFSDESERKRILLELLPEIIKSNQADKKKKRSSKYLSELLKLFTDSEQTQEKQILPPSIEKKYYHSDQPLDYAKLEED